MASHSVPHDAGFFPVESWESLHAAQGEQKTAPKRSKILLVDPSRGSRRSMRSSLGELDQEIIESASTAEAIAAISMNSVNLVLINLLAPEMGATEFCRMLKRTPGLQFLPVMVFAGFDDIEAEVGAIEAGADEFLIAPVRPRALRARVQASLRHKAMIDSLDDTETVLFSLAQSVEERDPTLGQHCQRLSLMASAMGVAMNLPPSEIAALQRGGYLHDIGKVAIPDSVLFKPGPLNEQEWKVMKSHAERGERICSHMRLLGDVLPIIRHHHERWDGSGYPDGLRGEEIPLLARILQVADIYDALTSARCYKRALSTEEALDVVLQETKRGWRDPGIVELFADVLPMFRTPVPMDFSRQSLQALAASIEGFRKSPARSYSRMSLFENQHQLVSGI